MLQKSNCVIDIYFPGLEHAWLMGNSRTQQNATMLRLKVCLNKIMRATNLFTQLITCIMIFIWFLNERKISEYMEQVPEFIRITVTLICNRKLYMLILKHCVQHQCNNICL